MVGNAQDVDDYGDLSNSTLEYYNDESEDRSLVHYTNRSKEVILCVCVTVLLHRLCIGDGPWQHTRSRRPRAKTTQLAT